MDKTQLIISKIEDLKESHAHRLDSIDENLRDHMHRTELAEKRIEHIEDRLTVDYLLKLTVKIATGIGAISGAVYGVYRLLGIL